MHKRLSLTLVAALIMGGCAHKGDQEYSKMLNQVPKWELDKTETDNKVFIDVSSDLDINKSPFIRIKTLGGSDENSESINIYRLDCANQRFANYYSKMSQKPTFEKEQDETGESEYASGIDSENFYYNPVQPKSVDRLWRSFPVGDNIFSKSCQLKETDIKPANTMLPDWTYENDLSNIYYATTYVKTDQLNQLQKNGSGVVSIKTFDSSTYDSNSSREDKVMVDCKAKNATLLEVIARDSDFEYAPAVDQGVFKYKKVFSPGQKVQAGTDARKDEWLAFFCK